MNKVSSSELINNIGHHHSWHKFTENGPHPNITQLWKLYSYITIRNFSISYRNCVSSLLSAHYSTFIFTNSIRFDQSPEPLIPIKNLFEPLNSTLLYSKIFNHDLIRIKNLLFTVAGRRGIAPTRDCTNLKKYVSNLFLCIKLNFFLQFFFLYLIYSLGGYNRNVTRPLRPRIHFLGKWV